MFINEKSPKSQFHETQLSVTNSTKFTLDY